MITKPSRKADGHDKLGQLKRKELVIGAIVLLLFFTFIMLML